MKTRRSLLSIAVLCLFLYATGCAKQQATPVHQSDAGAHDEMASESMAGLFSGLERGSTTRHICAYGLAYGNLLSIWMSAVRLDALAPVRTETERMMIEIGNQLGFKHSPAPSSVTGTDLGATTIKYATNCLIRLEEFSSEDPMKAFNLGTGMGTVLISLLICDMYPEFGDKPEAKNMFRSGTTLLRQKAEELRLPLDLRERIRDVITRIENADSVDDYRGAKDEYEGVFKDIIHQFSPAGSGGRY